MTAKEYLLRAWHIDRRIDARIEERDRLFERVESVRSPRLTGMPRGGHSDWTASVDRLIDLCHDIDAEIRELCRIKREVNEAIDSVEDMRMRRVLELRYRNYMTWEQIAAERGYEVRHVHRLHGEALLHVKRPAQ